MFPLPWQLNEDMAESFFVEIFAVSQRLFKNTCDALQNIAQEEGESEAPEESAKVRFC